MVEISPVRPVRAKEHRQVLRADIRRGHPRRHRVTDHRDVDVIGPFECQRAVHEYVRRNLQVCLGDADQQALAVIIDLELAVSGIERIAGDVRSAAIRIREALFEIDDLRVGLVVRVDHGAVFDRDAGRRKLEVVDADEPRVARGRLERQVLDRGVRLMGTRRIRAHDQQPEVDVLEHETGRPVGASVRFIDDLILVRVREVRPVRAVAGEEVDVAGAERQRVHDACLRRSRAAQRYLQSLLASEREPARDVNIILDRQHRMLDCDFLHDRGVIDVDEALRPGVDPELAAGQFREVDRSSGGSVAAAVELDAVSGGAEREGA